MEVDAAIIGKGAESTNWRDRPGKKIMNDEEQKKRRQEGRCFQCGRQGHMRRNCPRKGENGQRKFGPRKENARVTMTEGDDQPEEERSDNDHASKPPAYAKNDLIKSIKALDISERDELMDHMMDDPGF